MNWGWRVREKQGNLDVSSGQILRVLWENFECCKLTDHTSLKYRYWTISPENFSRVKTAKRRPQKNGNNLPYWRRSFNLLRPVLILKQQSHVQVEKIIHLTTTPTNNLEDETLAYERNENGPRCMRKRKHVTRNQTKS